jgi:yecA family protein
MDGKWKGDDALSEESCVMPDERDSEKICELRMELKRLEDKIIDFEKLDGLFAGLNCCPSVELPFDYLYLIWKKNAGGDPFKSEKEAASFMDLLVYYWKYIGDRLEEHNYQPFFNLSANMPGCNWAAGFILAFNVAEGGTSNFTRSQSTMSAFMPIFMLYSLSVISNCNIQPNDSNNSDGQDNPEDPHDTANDPDGGLDSSDDFDRSADDLNDPDNAEDSDLLDHLELSVERKILANIAKSADFLYFRLKKSKTAIHHPTCRNKNRKIGRNDPCPCKSGKKYKKCCLMAMEAEEPFPEDE